MNIQTIPYIIPLIIAGFIPLALASYLFRKKKSRVSIIFALVMIATSFWAFSYGLELAVEGLSATVFWNKFKFFAITTVPVFWISFALEYTGRKKWVNLRNIALLLAIPAIIIFSVWTNPFHNLFYTKLELNQLGGLARVAIAGNGGPAFAFHSAYSYFLIVLGAVLIIFQVTKLHRSYLKQALVLVAGTLTPLLGNAIYLAGVLPLPADYDITPVLFLAPGLAFTWSVLSFRFLDVVPVARDAVFEEIRDAAFVLDKEDRIVDFNKSAVDMLEEGYLVPPEGDLIGKEINEVFPDGIDLIGGEGEEGVKETELEGEEDRRFYDVRVSSLSDDRGELMARVMILRDITGRVESEERQDLLHSLLRHDLKNKVTVMDGYLDLLKGSELSGEQGEYLEKLQKVCEDSDDLIEKVRTLRKIGEEEESRKTNLNSILEDVVEERKTQAEEKDIELSYKKCEEVVYGGPLLEELFSNLVENSIKHSGCGLIRISCDVDGEDLIVNVEDDGCGISDEDKREVLERGVSKGDTGGSGLGMFLVRQIAEGYGGGMEVKDSELGGAKFEIRLKRGS